MAKISGLKRVGQGLGSKGKFSVWVKTGTGDKISEIEILYNREKLTCGFVQSMFRVQGNDAKVFLIQKLIDHDISIRIEHLIELSQQPLPVVDASEVRKLFLAMADQIKKRLKELRGLLK